jgi:hypothetical protein
MQSKITLIESPVKKARGRPRMIPIEELPIPKLTRSTNEPIPVAVVAEKKKRGRPRIMPIAVIEEPTLEPPAPPVVITQKKRGRPKKLII